MNENEKLKIVADFKDEIRMLSLTDEQRSIAENISEDIFYEHFEKEFLKNTYYGQAYWKTIDSIIGQEIRHEKERRENRS